MRPLMILSMVVLAVGCGDGGGGGGSADAAPGEDAGECIGHNCPQGPVDFDSDEGGEYRLEIIHTPGGTKMLRVISYFMDDMNPDHFPLPVVGGCTSFMEPGSLETKWPYAQGDDRVYVNMGDITLTGGPNPFKLSPQNLLVDYFFRQHDVAYAAETDATPFLVTNQVYDLEITGSADIEPFTYENWLYLPPALTLTDPGHDFVVTVPAGQDFTWHFEIAETPSADDFLISFLAFQNADDGQVTHVCLGDASTGEFTVPESVVSELLTSGIMVRGLFTHRLSELRFGSGRRIDVIGITCYAGAYIIGE